MTSVHSGETQLFDAELVTYRLEEAGSDPARLAGNRRSTRLRASSLLDVRAGCGRELRLVREAYPPACTVMARASPAWTRRWRGSR
jgi:hypothetical protein